MYTMILYSTMNVIVGVMLTYWLYLSIGELRAKRQERRDKQKERPSCP